MFKLLSANMGHLKLILTKLYTKNGQNLQNYFGFVLVKI